MLTSDFETEGLPLPEEAPDRIVTNTALSAALSLSAATAISGMPEYVRADGCRSGQSVEPIPADGGGTLVSAPTNNRETSDVSATRAQPTTLRGPKGETDRMSAIPSTAAARLAGGVGARVAMSEWSVPAYLADDTGYSTRGVIVSSEQESIDADVIPTEGVTDVTIKAEVQGRKPEIADANDGGSGIDNIVPEAVAEQPPHRLYHELQYVDGTHGRTATLVPASSEIIQGCETMRARAVDELAQNIGIPESEHAIPIAEIDAFFARLGLQTEPVIVFERNEEAFEEIGKIENPETVALLRRQDIAGLRSAKAGCCLVANCSGMTGYDDFELAVEMTAHEMGHSTGTVEYYYTVGDDRNVSLDIYRAGYTYSDVLDGRTPGVSQEEGRAVFLSNQFARTRGHVGVGEDVHPVFGFAMPAKYLRVVEPADGTEASIFIQGAANAAISFELLAARNENELDTELLERFITGDLRLEESVEAIQPGLWKRINEDRREIAADVDFGAVTRHIIDTLYGGDDNAPLAAAARVDQYMDAKLNV